MPQVLLNASQDGDSTTSLGSQFQCLTSDEIAFSDEIFPYIQPESHLLQLETIFPLAYFYLPGRRGDPHLSTMTSLEEISSQDTNLEEGYFTDYGLVLQSVLNISK